MMKQILLTKAAAKLSALTLAVAAVAVFALQSTGAVGPGESTPPEAGTLTPFQTTPAQNDELVSTSPLSQISVIYLGGGDDGIEKLWRAGKTILIKHGGVVVREIDCEDLSQLSFDFRNPGGIIIDFDPISEPGHYTMELPGGLVEMAWTSDTGGTTDPDQIIATRPQRVSAAYTLNFSIVETPEVTISPLPGKYDPADITSFTLTYPEGTVITAGSPIVEPAVYLFEAFVQEENGDVAYNVKTKAGSLTKTINGNKVTFSLSQTLPGLTQSVFNEWYYVMIPKNTLHVTLNGNEYDSPAFKFEKYDIRTIDLTTQLAISPMPADKDDFLGGDLSEVMVYFPEGYAPDPMWCAVGKTVGYLKQTTTSDAVTGYNVGTYKVKSIDTASRTMTVGFDAPESDEAYLNNPSNWMTSYFAVNINANLFKNATTNAKTVAVQQGGYYIPGNESFGATKVLPYNGGTLSNFNIVDPDKGFSKVQVEFPFPVQAVGSPVIELYANGTKVADATSFSIGEYTPTKVDVTFPATYKDKGYYTVVIPEGSFRQTQYGSYSNHAVAYRMDAPAPYPYEVTPAPGVVMSTALDLTEQNGVSEIRAKYAEGLRPIVSAFPDYTKISLNMVDMNENVFQKFHPATITVEGNEVVMTFDPKVTVGSNGQAGAMQLVIDQGAWRVQDSDGIISVNVAKKGYYKNSNLSPGELYIPSADDNSEVLYPAGSIVSDPKLLKKLIYKPTQQPINTVNLYSGNRIYLRKKLVEGAAEERLYEFSSKTNDGVGTITWSSTNKLLTLQAREQDSFDNIDGDVELVIPSGSSINFMYLGMYFNNGPIVYPFTIGEDPNAPQSIDGQFTPALPKSFTATQWNSKTPYGAVGLGIIVLNTSKQITGVNTACEDPIEFYYQSNVEAEKELIGSILTSDEECMYGGAAGAVDDDDPEEFIYGDQLTLVWEHSEDGFGLEQYSEQFTKKGLYTVKFPQGALKVGEKLSAPLSLHYSYDPEAPKPPVIPVFKPVDGSVVEGDGATLATIELTFPETEGDVDYNNGNRPVLKTADGTEVAANSYPTMIWKGSQGNGVILTFGKAANPVDWVEGEYTLTVPAGFITIDEEPWEGTTAKFTLKNGVKGWHVEITPAEPTVKVGGTLQLTAELYYNDEKRNCSSFVWLVKDGEPTDIITIADQTGLVTGLKEGTVTIQCVEGISYKYFGEATVTVQPDFKTITLDHDAGSLVFSPSVPMSFTVMPNSGKGVLTATHNTSDVTASLQDNKTYEIDPVGQNHTLGVQFADATVVGVDENFAADMHVYARNGRIEIVNMPEIATARLYTLDGQLLLQKSCEGVVTVIETGATGVCVLVIGNKVYKINL